ncbi:MAG: DUF4258 domain-containing protein [Chloroflexota bacterium]
MTVTIDPTHAVPRMAERGATRADVEYAVRHGTRSPAMYGRTCFTHTFAYNRKRLGKLYSHKSVLAYAVAKPPDEWLVVTVVVKYFNRGRRK